MLLPSLSRRIINSDFTSSIGTILCSRNINRSCKLNLYTQGKETYNAGTKEISVDEALKETVKNPKIILEGFKVFRRECKLFIKEIRDDFKQEYIVAKSGDIHMLFTFDSDDSTAKFILTTDKDNKGGYSTATFVRTQFDSAVFSGHLDSTPPDDGVTKFAGFAAINSKIVYKSFNRVKPYDWNTYTHLVMKIRGDGRTYNIILSAPDYFDATWQDQYHYPLYTRGGPYWQIVKIPLSYFYFTSAGTVQDKQMTVPLLGVTRLGIVLQDHKDGPFKLEIDYIGLERKPFHKAICPYEEYDFGNQIMGYN